MFLVVVRNLFEINFSRKRVPLKHGSWLSPTTSPGHPWPPRHKNILFLTRYRGFSSVQPPQIKKPPQGWFDYLVGRRELN
jgi:hypothetical protein